MSGQNLSLLAEHPGRASWWRPFAARVGPHAADTFGGSRPSLFLKSGLLLLLALILGLVSFSSHLAASRIYQVDECQNIYMARVLATGQAATFFTNASLFLLGPLSWIVRMGSSSETIFASARLLFLAVFWLNIFLLARIASGRLLSAKGLLALTAAATLAPLWDYGFEVRHDNIVLTGILLMWCALRGKRPGVWSYVLVGAVSVALLFVAVKSVVYVLPLSLAILAFPPPLVRPSGSSPVQLREDSAVHEQKISVRLRLALAWMAGAILALITVRICYGTGGKWEQYLSVFHGVAKFSAGSGGSPRFAPWFTLNRFLEQTPLLVAVSAAAVIGWFMEFKSRGRAALSWDSALPETLLVAGAMAGLVANPSPFPYNLLHVVPYAFLLGFRYANVLWQRFQNEHRLLPLVATVVLVVHGVPFVRDLQRHAAHSNVRQEYLMRLAERLTAPETDPVYDGIGMVPTRSSIGYGWYLHSLNMGQFLQGPGLRAMLAAKPAAVFIPSYRTDWLPEQEHEFIRSRYVELADDIWVLGKILPPGGGTFELIHAGRYRISTPEGSDLAGTYPLGWQQLTTPEVDGKLAGSLDGQALTAQVIEISTGSHRIECGAGQPVAIVWVGPNLERIHRSGSADHRSLFVNWY